jgi:phytoene dehydrogenase-like protein
MAGDSIIIIGAGLAGMSTGCYAQMNGYESHIFEHHSQPGGVAAAWQRGDYLIDGGIHFIMGHRPGTGLYELYTQLGIVPACKFLDMTTYGRFVHEPSGRSVLITHDLDRLAEDLKAFSPADAHMVDELVAGTRALQGRDMSEMGMSRPPELTGALDQLKDLWAMRGLLKYAMGRYGQSVAEYASAAHDPGFRTLLEGLFLPEVPVYFLFMILALLADRQLGYIDGSCLDVVRAIEKRYRDLGGDISYRATVKEILVENDRAVGVRLADGSEHRAGAVVSAADGHSTIFKMLGGRYVNDKIKDRYASWPLFSPWMIASYGVTRTFPDVTPFISYALERSLAIGGHEVKHAMIRICNYSARFAPPGKGVVQVEFEAEWDYWNDLQREDRARYDSEKECVASEILAWLETHYPGITSQVEVTDVVTPWTWWRYTLIRTAVERTLPGLDDFYMAGQWVMPGGGVPPVLYSGRHAVQLLCHRDGKQFVAEAT